MIEFHSVKDFFRGKKKDTPEAKSSTEAATSTKEAATLRPELTEAQNSRLLGLLKAAKAKEADDPQGAYDLYDQYQKEFLAITAGEPTPTTKLEGPIKEQIEQAEKIFGIEDFFGPAAVEKVFGTKFETKDIPAIPFSKEDLEHAKKLGQFLILRVDKAADGKLLTMEKMHGLLQPKFDKEKTGKVLASVDWYKDEDLFKKEAPQLRWALVTKEVVPDSTSKNYVDQTAILANYLKSKVFKGKTLPKEYQEAIAEFEEKKAKFGKTTKENWKEIAKQLSELKLNQLTRHTPAEVLYDMMIRFGSSPDKNRLLEKMYTWTSRLTSDGELVGVGGFDAGGVSAYDWRPDDAPDDVGVSFSRSH